MSHLAPPAPLFPQTKLSPPLVEGDTLARPRLLEALRAAVAAHRLTLLLAPAGYGKTTLLATWLRESAAPHVAWLALDGADNDPDTLLAALRAALERALPGAPFPPLAAGGAHEDALRASITLLVNALAAYGGPPPTLVLDDLHLITSRPVLAGLDELIAHMPPGVRVVAAARHAPALGLARLRARGQLAEIGAEALRFSAEETAAWLGGRPGLALADEALRALHASTEGWGAAVRLLALALAPPGSADVRADMLAALARGQRYVFDFLADEVLRHQEPELHDFLVRSSVLDELTPGACRAITGRDDAAALLETAYRRSLFLSLAEGAPTAEPAYRPHALFAAFLRRQLAQERPGELRDLHRRAAAAQAVPAAAIGHLLAAEDWEAAAARIEAVGRQRLATGSLAPVRAWIGALPAPLRAARPWLALLLGADAVHAGRYEAAQPLLERALHAFADADDPAGLGEVLVLLGETYTCVGDRARAEPLLAQSLRLPLPLARRVKARVNLLWSAYLRGDWAAVDAGLAPLIDAVITSGDTGALRALVESIGPQFACGRAGPRPLERLCRHAVEQLGAEMGPPAASAHAYLGYLHALRGDWPAARKAADAAEQICAELGGLAHVALFADHVRLFDAMGAGDHAALDARWRAAVARAESLVTDRPFLACYLALRARAAWLSGDAATVRELAARARAIDDPHPFPEHTVALALLESLAARADGDLAAAEAHLLAAVAAEERTRHPLLLTSGRLGLAELRFATGRADEALALLDQALETPGWPGWPGALAQEGAGLIPLLGRAAGRADGPPIARRALELLGGAPAVVVAPAPVAIPGAPETISQRELEVLRLLAAGLSNQEIGARLYISAGTVKRHTINLYGKLGVHTRTQAIARARALGLLDG